jgi:hypothetical protein
MLDLFGGDPSHGERMSATFACGTASKSSVEIWTRNHALKILGLKGIT